MQSDLFDFLYDKFELNRNEELDVIELFAGYGSQSLALKYLNEKFGNIKYNHHKICEWALNSIIAYASVHRNELKNYGIDYCKDMTKEEIAHKLEDLGVSLDYNSPATFDKLKRVNEERLRLCYNSIKWSNNLVDITRVKGADLEIQKDKPTILFYSFPCQSLSLAGKQDNLSDKESINEDNIYDIENRSNMVWQVIRILGECENKPTILIMENVSQIHNNNNAPFFNQIKDELNNLGYTNWEYDMSAVDYGIPQTRNRTFMVSILGEQKYTFPAPIDLKLRLKDMLESNVDESFYLSDKIIEQISNWKSYQNPLENVMGRESVCGTITTRIAESQDGGINASMKVYSDNLENTSNLKPSLKKVYEETENSSLQQHTQEDKRLSKHLTETLSKNNIDEIKDVGYIDAYNRKISNDGLAATISTRVSAGNDTFIAIKNNTKKGYLEATDGDGIDISSRMEYHRGTVQKGKRQTLTTSGGDSVGVCVGTYDYAQSDTLRPSESERLHLDKNVSGTILASGNHNGVVIKDSQLLGGFGTKGSTNQYRTQNRIYSSSSSSPAITTAFNPNYAVNEKTHLRIRKLTPKECGRLMGVKDRDIDLISQNQTNAGIYHLFGDSIVCYGVLTAIIGKLYGLEWERLFDNMEWWNND